MWDLRIDDKIYIYLTNFSDKPLCVLCESKKTIGFFEFDNYFLTNKIDIVFKNSKGNVCNFYNLSHELVFLLECIN